MSVTDSARRRKAPAATKAAPAPPLAGGGGEREEPGYHHGDLKRALVEAGIEILEAEGLKGLSLRALARHVGVSPAAPYHHFPDRSALYCAIAAEGFRRFVEVQRARTAEMTDPEEKLKARGVGYVLFAAEHPELYRLMFGNEIAPEDMTEELQADSKGAFGCLREVVAELPGLEDDPDAQARMALSAWSTVHGLSHIVVDNRGGVIAEEVLGRPAPKLDIADVEALAEASVGTFIARKLPRG